MRESGFCRSGGSVIAGEAGKVLAKAVGGSEAVVAGLVKIGERRPTVPSTHLFARTGESGALAEWHKEAIFVEGRVEGVIGLELLTEWGFE